MISFIHLLLHRVAVSLTYPIQTLNYFISNKHVISVMTQIHTYSDRYGAVGCDHMRNSYKSQQTVPRRCSLHGLQTLYLFYGLGVMAEGDYGARVPSTICRSAVEMSFSFTCETG